MKKLTTLLFCVLFALVAKTQTTVYTTGQTYPDAWTGWSTPVVTGTTGSSINGANIYTFSGTASTAYTIEIYRQFTISSNDLDLYLAATTENCTVSVLFSTDNVSYTEIGSQVWGAGFATSTLVIPTYDPVGTTFYLKLKMVGTFGSQSNFNNFKIDAVIDPSASVDEFALGKSLFYSNGILSINTSNQAYEAHVFDINGRLIASEQNMKSYDFVNNDPGIYFVSFVYNGARKTVKISHIK